MRRLDDITDSIDMSLSKLWEIVKDREARRPWGPKELDTTEQLHFILHTSRLVITFLPRRNYLLISWLQSPSAVILKPKKIKSVTVSIVSPSICHEVMGQDATILVF